MPARSSAPVPGTRLHYPRRVSDLRERLSALDPSARQFVKFALVGGLGTVTNLALFFVLVDATGQAAPLAGSAICFAVAVSQNYVFNEVWTFRVDAAQPVPLAQALSASRYAKFVAASLVGFAINAGVLVALLATFTFPLAIIPQAAGIAAGMAFNFVASKRAVFRR